jgi:hypothetical protein
MKNRNLLAALAGAVVSVVFVTLETRRQTDTDEIRNDVAEAVAPDES